MGVCGCFAFGQPGDSALALGVGNCAQRTSETPWLGINQIGSPLVGKRENENLLIIKMMRTTTKLLMVSLGFEVGINFGNVGRRVIKFRFLH